MHRRDLLGVLGAMAAGLVAVGGPAAFGQQREVATEEHSSHDEHSQTGKEAAKFSHAQSRNGWGGPIEPWEIHPALNHLPIAFLLGGVALDLYSWLRRRPDLAKVATGLLVAGVLTGILAGLAGLLAFFTVPGHTEEAHRLMFWHMGLQAAALLLFAWPAWKRWRNWALPPSAAVRLTACLAGVLLLVGSAVGGYIVYHGGAGIVPELLAPELRGGHPHSGNSAEHSPSSNPSNEADLGDR
jgi:uncharacterized membrane protein